MSNMEACLLLKETSVNVESDDDATTLYVFVYNHAICSTRAYEFNIDV